MPRPATYRDRDEIFISQAYSMAVGIIEDGQFKGREDPNRRVKISKHGLKKVKIEILRKKRNKGKAVRNEKMVMSMDEYGQLKHMLKLFPATNYDF